MLYFTIDELCRSNTASRMGIDNTPSADVVANLKRLVDDLLDPLRKAWGSPLRVNSGYRSPALNKKIGGAANSHHVRGMAADVTAGSKSNNEELFRLVQKSNLPFTQLIDESGYSWVHVSLDPNDVRKQVLHL